MGITATEKTEVLGDKSVHMILLHHIPHIISLQSKSGLCGERSATNHLGYGTTSKTNNNCGKRKNNFFSFFFLYHVSRNLLIGDKIILVAFAKLRKATNSFVASVCPHRTTRVLLDEF